MTSDKSAAGASATAEEIQEWMVAYLARELDTAPQSIDVTAPFESFALDSAAAIGMTGDLEQWLGRRIDPTVVYDYPTIEEFSEYLADRR
ncbi:acyl carrier protein [Blastopirellula sp. JC732]|uniref:Acyl carrier protein n=1 Tax=Blastopirellula sediminis TaxID=2894196 RepID=A0A9X1SHB0_9BACT|nr:acyl carrier protein [Blastopirellula sediminis]MCC9607071.1 acyl carrier protein [Blastopirellula sediminis]MCC9629636.1 acyl carrier protein [Blastopirellula sediminis]